MASSMMDTKLMVHVGVELVMFGGMLFLIQRNKSVQGEQIFVLSERVAKLEEENEKLTAVINQQNQILHKHEQILSHLFGGGGGGGGASHAPSQIPIIPETSTRTPSGAAPRDDASTKSAIAEAQRNKDMDDLLKSELDEIEIPTKKSVLKKASKKKKSKQKAS